MGYDIFYSKKIKELKKVTWVKLIAYLIPLALITIVPPFESEAIDSGWVYFPGLIIFTILLPKYLLKINDYIVIHEAYSALKIVGCLFLIITIFEIALFPLDKWVDYWDQLSLMMVLSRALIIFWIGYVEEYIYRKILFSYIFIKTRRLFLSEAISALVFCLMHIPILLRTHGHDTQSIMISMSWIFFMGILFADLYYLKRNLFLIALIHTLIDFSYLFNGTTISTLHSPLGLLFLILITATIRVKRRKACSKN